MRDMLGRLTVRHCGAPHDRLCGWRAAGMRRSKNRAPVAPSLRRCGLFFEDQPEMVHQLALEADAFRAHSGGEREAELAARRPLRHEPRLDERLAPARLAETGAPLLDRLDVVEPPALGRDEPEVRL